MPGEQGDAGSADGFRIGCVGGRAALRTRSGWVDLASASGDERLADVNTALADPSRVSTVWADVGAREGVPLVKGALGPCVPHPRQIFAIGLNYHDHLIETGLPVPEVPMVFTKFPSSVAGPDSRVALTGDSVDWEAELVVVVGAGGRDIATARAWEALAAITVGQDLSDRALQLAATPPQFSLGKSHAGFAPLAGVAVGLAAFETLDDIAVWCTVDGHLKQSGRTADLIFSVPELVAYLSSVCELLPGDLIFTGTPAGVGSASGRFLRPGSTIVTGADVVGEFTTTMVGEE